MPTLISSDPPHFHVSNSEGTENVKSVTVFIADNYAPGCPSNKQGKRHGVGFTREEAIENCAPWANQAAWFRRTARRVLVTDGPWPSGDADLERVFDWHTGGGHLDIDPEMLASALIAELDGAR